ncbi:Limonene 1,2-monooxygenase [Flavobacterium columnare]|uniref:LLM class flavin-dependent oxidoreductase n=2 Tax=Flavobacterium TaxID=237 RepID=A0ABW8PKU5_9FLAO|nr:LLM class flavin-dependent oxidoreductase [Flavobacterium columnare]SPE77539.1 Limonene 1,2-monooxygenase [Flavobacterium columnare]
MINLGIIELGFREDSNAVQSIQDIIEYAIEAEKKGFSKFWLAEHHYSHIKNHPYSNAEILLTLIAGMTDTIKLGTAGTSINLYSPYHTASNFKLLNNLFHGRISIGLSKGLPDSQYINSLANKELSLETNFNLFNKNLETIVDLYEKEDENLEEKKVLIPPFKGIKPEMCYLSTSTRNLSEALKYGLNYCISTFHNFGQDINNLKITKEEINKFREDFYFKNDREPEISLSLAIVLKDTIEEAQTICDEIVENSRKQSSEPFIIIPVTLDLLEERLIKWKEEFAINNFIIYDLATTNEEKLKNLELIGEKFNLLVTV